MIRQSKNRVGVTLLELLIVAAIIALLLAIALPAIGKARKSTNKTICAGYHRQLIFGGPCNGAKLKLEAFDMGCYEYADDDMSAFELPDDVSKEDFRKQLEADVEDTCH
jgi:prepilin-type N-terminal cleavage/methylation domain-containing protein